MCPLIITPMHHLPFDLAKGCARSYLNKEALWHLWLALSFCCNRFELCVILLWERWRIVVRSRLLAGIKHMPSYFSVIIACTHLWNSSYAHHLAVCCKLNLYKDGKGMGWVGSAAMSVATYAFIILGNSWSPFAKLKKTKLDILSLRLHTVNTF